MSELDALLPLPRLLEVDSVDLAIPPTLAWEALRHSDLGAGALVRALFALRTVAERSHAAQVGLRFDNFGSSESQPGFQILAEREGTEIVVGAIGKVWQLDIPFKHVESATDFARFVEPEFIKVAWALRLEPIGANDTRVAVEVRVDATDEAAWRKFRWYFRLIGPGSRFIRRSFMAELARRFGTREGRESERAMAGDDLIADVKAQVTQGITIAARPSAIFPWLLQMGCHRGGFYSYDALDNANARSAREVHPDLQSLAVGDSIPATPRGDATFEVLAIEPGRALVLGGLHDLRGRKQLPFHSERPSSYWQSTWAFELEPLTAETTRLHVRARAACSDDARLRSIAMAGIHRLMEGAQLRHLARRIEGREARDDWRDVASGLGGAAVVCAALLTPFMRRARSHWGLTAEQAAVSRPGDDWVRDPRWSWTHAVEIEASAEQVWPWVGQIGADRAGFYSYQWLENVAGCGLRNAERVHPEWQLSAGDALSLHPRIPPFEVVEVAPGRWLVARAHASNAEREAGKPWAEATWLFLVEPLGPTRCRLISRYRVACSDDLTTRLAYGEALMEPIGFAMDRRMLLGVKARAEREA